AGQLGVTADVAAGVGVGNDNNARMNKVTGGSLPTRIWHDFMAEVEAGKPVQPLAAPGGELPMASLYPAPSPPPAAPAASAAPARTLVGTGAGGTNVATDPQRPLGNNTPSPAIQNIIDKLKVLSDQRKK